MIEMKEKIQEEFLELENAIEKTFKEYKEFLGCYYKKWNDYLEKAGEKIDFKELERIGTKTEEKLLYGLKLIESMQKNIEDKKKGYPKSFPIPTPIKGEFVDSYYLLRHGRVITEEARKKDRFKKGGKFWVSKKRKEYKQELRRTKNILKKLKILRQRFLHIKKIKEAYGLVSPLKRGKKAKKARETAERIRKTMPANKPLFTKYCIKKV